MTTTTYVIVTVTDSMTTFSYHDFLFNATVTSTTTRPYRKSWDVTQVVQETYTVNPPFITTMEAKLVIPGAALTVFFLVLLVALCCLLARTRRKIRTATEQPGALRAGDNLPERTG